MLATWSDWASVKEKEHAEEGESGEDLSAHSGEELSGREAVAARACRCRRGRK